MRYMKVLKINSYSYSPLVGVNKYRPKPNSILTHTGKKEQLKNYCKVAYVSLSLHSFSKYLFNTQYM